MRLVSNKEAQKIFLTTNSKISNFSSNIDIIISPEFYWVRKFEIPVKTETQARHVLPTLFEDVIDNILILSYQVIKLGDNIFLCFAYNNKKIFEAIKASNIPISNISSIYFAQNECKGFPTFKVDNVKFMYTDEDILVKVPSKLLGKVIELNKVLNKIKVSSHKVQMKLYNDVINSKYYYALFVIFCVLILLNSVQYFNYSNEIKKIEKSIEKSRKIATLPSSMLQANAILSKYDKSIKKELKKRDAIEYILTNSKFDLKSLSIKNEIINLEYLSVNKNEVDKFIGKKYKILSSKMSSFVLKIRIQL